MVCAIRNAGGEIAATGAAYAIAAATIAKLAPKPTVEIRMPPILLDQECHANL
jgi:hypothetical protein